MIDLARNSAWLLIDIAIVSILTAGALVVLWVVATNLRDCWRAFLWLGAAIRRGRVSPERTANPPPAPVFPSAAHLSLDAQWTRVTGVVASGIGRTRAMERIHGAAAVQVDAALYGLERLGAELTGLVPLAKPAGKGAEIHWLRDRLKGRERTDHAEAA